MTEASAELRRLAETAYRALNEGQLDEFLAMAGEDLEFTSMIAEAEGTTFRGHDGVRAWWETVRGAFEDVSWELLEVQAWEDRGLIRVRITGTIRGVPVEQTMWQAFRARDGKARWWSFFRTEEEALRALGLAQPGAR